MKEKWWSNLTINTHEHTHTYTSTQRDVQQKRLNQLHKQCYVNNINFIKRHCVYNHRNTYHKWLVPSIRTDINGVKKNNNNTSSTRFVKIDGKSFGYIGKMYKQWMRDLVVTSIEIMVSNGEKQSRKNKTKIWLMEKSQNSILQQQTKHRLAQRNSRVLCSQHWEACIRNSVETKEKRYDKRHWKRA